MGERALVLGGGGVTGVAWELGLLAGLADAGVDLTTADVVIGTSAGSVVGALITNEPVKEAYERQLLPPSAERPARVSAGLVLRYASAALIRDPQRARARIGAMALAAQTLPESDRRAVIAARLAAADWPTTQRLVITAVAADDGEFLTFERNSGLSLVDAVGASCAVPGVWPPVTIGGRRYIDGGVRSPANVDLAADCDGVVVVAPITTALRRSVRPAAQLAALPSGARSLLVTPDAGARQAIGRNVLDPARRAAAARAGWAQAAAVAEAVRAAWDSTPA